jgi:hypothetical protein
LLISIGSRRIRSSLPSGSDHTRTVLSSDAVTAKRFSASVSMRLIIAPCWPASIRSMGSVEGAQLTCARPLPKDSKAVAARIPNPDRRHINHPLRRTPRRV